MLPVIFRCVVFKYLPQQYPVAEFNWIEMDANIAIRIHTGERKKSRAPHSLDFKRKLTIVYVYVRLSC